MNITRPLFARLVKERIHQTDDRRLVISLQQILRLLPVGGIEVKGFLIEGIEEVLSGVRRLVIRAGKRFVENRLRDDQRFDRNAKEETKVIECGNGAWINDGNRDHASVLVKRQQLIMFGKSQWDPGYQFGSVLPETHRRAV